MHYLPLHQLSYLTIDYTNCNEINLVKRLANTTSTISSIAAASVSPSVRVLFVVVVAAGASVLLTLFNIFRMGRRGHGLPPGKLLTKEPFGGLVAR